LFAPAAAVGHQGEHDRENKSVESALHREKKGTLKSGSGRKVTSRKQAIAIGLSEAREKGAKVPPPKASSSRKGSSKTAARKTSRKTSGPGARKSTAKKR
jgi:hypothetical protein